jgi:hypothetical protein
MEEIEATRVALDSRLVNAYKLRCRSSSCLVKIAQSRKDYARQRFGINLD